MYLPCLFSEDFRRLDCCHMSLRHPLCRPTSPVSYQRLAHDGSTRRHLSLGYHVPNPLSNLIVAGLALVHSMGETTVPGGIKYRIRTQSAMQELSLALIDADARKFIYISDPRWT